MSLASARCPAGSRAGKTGAMMARVAVRESMTLAARAFLSEVLGPGHLCGDVATLLFSEVFGVSASCVRFRHLTGRYGGTALVNSQQRTSSGFCGRGARSLGASVPERERQAECGPGLVYQGVRVVAQALGGLVAGDGDLPGEEGGGPVGPAADKNTAQLLGELLHLHGVAGEQLWVLTVEALRSEGKIGAHYVSQPRKATFIEVIAADEKQVAETLATLPFARFFDVDVYPTAPPDEAEAAHRARLSREPSTRG